MENLKTKVDPNQCPVNAQYESTGHSRSAGHSRTSVGYWRDRVEKVKSRPGEKGKESPHYSARIAYKKKRVRFPLETPNREAAAKKASLIFQFLVDNGWEETLEKFKPGAGKQEKAIAVEESSEDEPVVKDTVGDLIKASTALSTARPQTKDAYEKAFRKIVASIEGIEDGRKFDAKQGGVDEWRRRVDSVKLASITPSRVVAWKNRYITDTGTDPTAKRSATVTVNSLIRNAKSLFSKKLLRFLAEEVELPNHLPFEGVPMEKQPSVRYQSKIDALEILRKAEKELMASQPELFKAFLFALEFGLRRSEIDHLLWEAIDFENGILRIEHTEFHELKSDDSAGELDIKPETLQLLKCLREESQSKFVIDSGNQPRTKNRHSRCNRCDTVFNKLIKWLKDQGITSRKPIHELRKEIGSIIASEYGVFEASRYLRHSDIRITAQIYLDKKRVVTPSLRASSENT